jgi:hypothetical protein
MVATLFNTKLKIEMLHFVHTVCVCVCARALHNSLKLNSQYFLIQRSRIICLIEAHCALREARTEYVYKVRFILELAT